MDKLPTPKTPKPDSQGSRPGSVTVLPDRNLMPKVYRPIVDTEIPRRVWSAWKPSGGEVRKLRRALTDVERDALENRRDELAPFVRPYEGEREERQVLLALSDMFASFRSQRNDDQDTVAQIDIVRRNLREFPAWAIERACQNIQINGIWRNGKLDRQWPPNDAEIVKEVRDYCKLYGDSYRSAVALLTAEVER